MCGNPFKIGDKVDGSYEVERATTSFTSIDFNKLNSRLEWREIEEGLEVLTLDEILDQAMKRYAPILFGRMPFIRVNYETGMWGAIFEVGNYRDAGRQWYVHGVTKGYA